MPTRFQSICFAVFVILAGNAVAEARPQYVGRLFVVFPETKTRWPQVKCADCHVGRGKKMRSEYGKKLELALKGKKNVRDREVVEDALVKIGKPPLPVRVVSEMNKQVFFAALAQLPMNGATYTKDAVARSARYLPVILAMSENDLNRPSLSSLITLSRRLAENKQHRKDVRAVFADIAHPTIRNTWAIAVFKRNEATPEIVRHLQTMLQSKPGTKELSDMLGEDFQSFRERVLKAKPEPKP